jgi:tetratricopeptide (TPR) repeat protein
LLVKKTSTFRLTILDLLVLFFLLIIPVAQYVLVNDVMFAPIVQQIAYSIVYVSLRILFANLAKPVVATAAAESIGIITFFHIAIAFAQHAGVMPVYYSGAGATGMFFNPGPFGIYTSALVLFSYVLLRINLRTKRRGNAIGQGITIILGSWLVFSSLSRSAWLGLVIGVILLSLWIAVQDGSFVAIQKKRWFSLIGIGLLVIMVFAGWKAYTFKQKSADGRLLTWNSSTMLIQDHWLNGVGISNFAPNYIHYQAAYFKKHGNENQLAQLAGDSRYAFNDLLQAVAEYGMIGALLLLGVLTLVCSYLFVPMTDTTNASFLLVGGGLAFVISIIVAGLSAYPMQMVPLALLFWIGIAMAASSRRLRPIVVLTRRVPKIAVALLLVTASALFIGYGHQRAFAYYDWNKSEGLPTAERYEKLFQHYAVLRENGEYLGTLGGNLLEMEEYEQALRYLQEAVTRTPSPAVYYALAECHASLGDYAEAIRMVGTIKRGIPNLFRPRFLEATYTHKQGDTDGFRNLAKQALAFEPKVNNIEVVKMKNELRRILTELDIEKD